MALEQKVCDPAFFQQPVSTVESDADGCDLLPLPNLTRINLASLRLAVLCASEGSLTRAAPLCNMSLMAASRRLRLLEETFGCAIFHRRRTSLELTDAGVVVIEAAQTIIQLVNDMSHRVLHIPASYGRMHENLGRSTRDARS